jgi:hypothetical protein
MEQRCEECGGRMTGLERGWRLVLAGDPERTEVVPTYYCPVCARRVLDELDPEHPWGPVTGDAPAADGSRMEFTIEFEAHGVDVLITTNGVANADGFLRLNRALTADARFRPGMAVLVDHSSLDTRRLTEEDLRETAASFAEMRDRVGTSKIAFLVSGRPSAEQVETARAHAQPMETEMREFYSRADAIAWLQAPTEAAKLRT